MRTQRSCMRCGGQHDRGRPLAVDKHAAPVTALTSAVANCSKNHHCSIMEGLCKHLLMPADAFIAFDCTPGTVETKDPDQLGSRITLYNL